MIKISSGTDLLETPDNFPKVVIAHCCNDLGVMGSGVAKFLRDKWPQIFAPYETQCLRKSNLGGCVTFAGVEENALVANIIGQSGVASQENIEPVRYSWLSAGLQSAAFKARVIGATLHIPYKMGADRAGGDFDFIMKIFREVCEDNRVKGYVHDLYNQHEA